MQRTLIIIAFFISVRSTRASAPFTDSLTFLQVEKLTEALKYCKLMLQSGRLAEITLSTDSLKYWEQDRKTILTLRDILVSTGDLDFFENNPVPVVDSMLIGALKKYQKRNGLVPSGILDKVTLKNIRIPIAYRIQQIELNIQRWENFFMEGEELYVMVNIPDFTLRVIKNGRIDFVSKVIVGKKMTSTDLFNDEIEQIILNPSWYVPNSIEKNELFQKIKRDPGYVARNHMKLYDERNNRKETNVSQIDFSGMSASSFHYSIEQTPGPWNALGRIKFLFPNPYSVYLHDTPEKTIFKNQVRAYSHGCVRVEKPLELAAYLLSDQKEWDMQTIQKAINSGFTKAIVLPKHIPISLSYFTCWIDEQNDLQMRDDIMNWTKERLKNKQRPFSGNYSAAPLKF